MTNRSGLYVALVGLVLTLLCALPLLSLRFFEDTEWARNPDAGSLAFVFALSLGVFLGLIVLAVGLIMTAVGAVTKKS